MPDAYQLHRIIITTYFDVIGSGAELCCISVINVSPLHRLFTKIVSQTLTSYSDETNMLGIVHVTWCIYTRSSARFTFRSRKIRVSRIREIISLPDFNDFMSYKRYGRGCRTEAKRRRGFLKMWLDNGRKDGLLEKWYVVRKDNEARASQELR